MSILLGQLPPAEVARLKAELAETLIANFCYPRFFDYRTGSLRMRPVDRNKRQEVWLYLSSVDFTSWSRVDLMSPDFQRQIERLFIHFVQRNRNFFGDQGRKRMADVRMLISSSASSVTERLRSYLKGHQQSNSPFGSPRPVFSWTASNVTGHPEPSWEQLASRTTLIQQQLQEVRGEIKTSITSNTNTATPNEATQGTRELIDAPQAPLRAPTRRSTRGRSNGNGTGSIERDVPVPPTPNVAVNKPAPQADLRPPTLAAPISGPKTTNPLNPPADSTVAPPPSAQTQTRSLSQTPQAPRTAVTVGKSEDTTVLISDEDVVIFEQMRYQLIVWLRIEAVRSGADISGQGPIQLLELLHKQDTIDDSRLQVVSTLLNLSDQVITNRHATLLDYKQAMMFYLMHTRRS